jgi:hypothetical protein
MDLDPHRTLKLWPGAVKGLAQLPIQLRVAGFPNLVTRMNSGEIDSTAPEGKSSQSVLV